MKLTANFSLDEFACRCGCGYERKPEIQTRLADLAVKVLQPLRDRLGRPIRINSGARCPNWNKRVGGKPHSYHQRGQAADIQVDGMTPRQVIAIAQGMQNVGGYNAYDTFCHLDTGPRRTW